MEQMDFGTPEEKEAFRQKTLRSFMRNGKITQIPSQLKKRIILWEEVAKLFEKGKDYAEHEVNETIAKVCEDYCTVRREMINVGLMTRTDAVYRLAE